MPNPRNKKLFYWGQLLILRPTELCDNSYVY